MFATIDKMIAFINDNRLFNILVIVATILIFVNVYAVGIVSIVTLLLLAREQYTLKHTLLMYGSVLLAVWWVLMLTLTAQNLL